MTFETASEIAEILEDMGVDAIVGVRPSPQPDYSGQGTHAGTTASITVESVAHLVLLGWAAGSTGVNPEDLPASYEPAGDGAVVY